MKQAFYHTPDRAPKAYDCKEGAKPGTVDLLNAKGRVIVAGLPLVADETATAEKSFAVIVKAASSAPKPAPAKAPETAPVAD